MPASPVEGVEDSASEDSAGASVDSVGSSEDTLSDGSSEDSASEDSSVTSPSEPRFSGIVLTTLKL